MAAPLVVRGTTIGVLVVQTREPREFDGHDVGIFQTCAQLIAPVVINARLLALVGQSAEERRAAARNSGALGDSGSGTEPGTSRRERRIPRHPDVARASPSGRSTGCPTGRLLAHSTTPPARRRARRSDLKQALHEARRELDTVREDLGEQFGPDFAAVFHTHVQILEDKGFRRRSSEDEVRETGNALEALRAVLAYRRTFERIEDPYFRDRVVDVEDVGRRVMERLLGVRHHMIPHVPEGSIVVADNILPGIFAEARARQGGGARFRARRADIARRDLRSNPRDPGGDGHAGDSTGCARGRDRHRRRRRGAHLPLTGRGLIDEYERAQQRYEVVIEHLDALRGRPAETRDGRRIRLTANAGLVGDLRLIEKHGAEGIGLFRTEMLAIAHRGFPEEEEQEQLFERVAGALAPRPDHDPDARPRWRQGSAECRRRR